MFVFSFLTIWARLVLSSISWSLSDKLLRICTFSTSSSRLARKTARRPFPLLAFFTFYRNKNVTRTFQDFAANIFLLPSFPSGCLDDERVPPQTCPMLFMFLLVAQRMPHPPDLCNQTQNTTASFYLEHFSLHLLGYRRISVYPWYTEKHVICFTFQWELNKIHRLMSAK